MESRFTTRVSAPDGRSWPKVRVLVGDGRLHVFRPAGDRSPELVASEPLTGEPVDVGGRWYLPTAEGNWTVLGPCGCPSPAKAWTTDALARLVPA